MTFNKHKEKECDIRRKIDRDRERQYNIAFIAVVVGSAIISGWFLQWLFS